MFPCSLLAVLLFVTGCSSPEVTSLPESPPKKDPCDNIESAVQKWVRGNVAELSKEIGSLVTRNFPLVRDIVAKAIETALLTWIEFPVEAVEPMKGGDGFSVRVKLEFPLEMQIPLGDKKGYRVSVKYDVIVEKGEVTDSAITLSSFEMKESSD